MWEGNVPPYNILSTVELGYNDLGLCDTSIIKLYIHQLIPH